MSYGLLPGTYIGSLEMTTDLFHNMKKVSEGRADANKVLASMRQMVIHDRKKMLENSKTMRKDLGVKVADYPKKEKAEGIFKPTGSPVSFSREYSGHRFTDDEVNALLNGDTIQVYDLVSGRTGNKFSVEGKLEEQEYKGHKFWGFKGDFINKPGVPDRWCGHTFTDEEKEKLEGGFPIFVTGLKSRAGKIFDANLVYDDEEEPGKKKLRPIFDK